MAVLPPGTLLQLTYLRERLTLRKPGYFIEVGPGTGETTKLLLELGWSGESYDLDENTVIFLKSRFAKEISDGRYIPNHSDFISSAIKKNKADLVISSMVMEHLDDNSQNKFLNKSADCLSKDGIIINIVPASPRHWGIEDDIAGHFRRYTRQNIVDLAHHIGLKLNHIAGLTFPISNFLVNKAEHSKLDLPPIVRTMHSGRRRVKFKTYFPSIFNIILNKYTIYPLHLLQKLFTNSEDSLVIYFELQPSLGSSTNANK